MADEILSSNNSTSVVRLDPEKLGSKSEYAVFPANSRAALALISMDKCSERDLLEVLIAHKGGERVSSIKDLIETLKWMV
jgi:hypothetical protein